MNKDIMLYRKRLIPEELFALKNDLIIYADDQSVITRWNTLKPRRDIAYGFSAYLLDKGFKISKVYDHQDELVYWYCDIIKHSYDSVKNALLVTDLLIDVVVLKDGSSKVLDLDEIVEALHHGLLTTEDMCQALTTTDLLLKDIYDGQFKQYQDLVEKYEK